jgi:4-amino-4-deoxy-L-arabinose transferase-like glycosyltransferase
VGFAAVAGIALRIWTYRLLMGTPNGDEAVVGLMTRHAAHGELTTFYWGQGYRGPQEAWLTVPVFWVFGSTWLGLRLVPMALTVVAVLIVWRVGRRTIGEPAATVSAALLWVWPPFAVFELVHQQGFYAADVVYSALLLLLALRVAERPDRRRVAEFGLVLGLAFWETVQIVTVAVGLIGWIAWKAPRSLRHIGIGVAAAVLGALPWLVWNAAHGWVSLKQGQAGAPLRSLRLLASPYLPMMAGLRAPFSGRLLLPSAALTYAVYVAVLGLFVVAGWKARNRPASILYVVAAAFPLLYTLAPYTAGVTGNPRYTMVLVPVLVLLFGQCARGGLSAAAVIIVACVVSVVTLQRMNHWFGSTPHPTTQVRGLGARDVVQLVPRHLGGLVATLDRLHLKYVYTDYWLAYRLDFDSHEHIVATENRLIGMTFENGTAVPTLLHTRWAPYAEAVQRANHGFVFYRKLVGSATVVPALERHGYRRYSAGRYVVFARPP